MKLTLLLKVIPMFFSLALASNVFAQCVSIPDATTYNQDFNTLSSVATPSALLPTGWSLVETGTSAAVDQQYEVSTGGTNAGNVYSYGVAGTNPVTDRAFGMQFSNTLTPLIGGCFKNDRGTGAAQILIGYTGEQWRKNSNATQDSITVEYSLNATSINDALATWVAVPALTFTGPIADAGTGVALDGNAPANRAVIPVATINATFPASTNVYVRFVDTNIASTDHGLGIDDFSFATVVTTAASVSISGRVSTFEGNAISRARVSMVDSNGALRSTTTNQFGFYSFTDVAGGSTYVLSVRSKLYEFAQPTQVISASEDVSGVNFVALPSVFDFAPASRLFSKLR